MQRGVYSAATAMESAQQWLDVVSHNLANAATVGYKRDVASFDDGLVRYLRADGGSGALLGSIGAGAVAKGIATDFSTGPETMTGNPLDVAIKSGNGAFAVQTPQGVRFTRDGSFSINTARQLTDQQGRLVLDENRQPITLPRGEPSIEADGSVKVQDHVVGKIGVFSGSFAKAGFGLFESNDARPIAAPELLPRTLEMSNVNVVSEMIAMIRLNRAFELAQRSVQSQDASTDRLIQSLQGR
ncbi:MAG: flagellar hook-basal body protein [Fimbriimonadaceae bacterium]|nr:flagellar hook-basal body protein [Fimbriimonadaceae bacterium]QYK55899.1 MAG: flagellar hook-basal body protein [Fimbriimonadaceae bacterium]